MARSRIVLCILVGFLVGFSLGVIGDRVMKPKDVDLEPYVDESVKREIHRRRKEVETLVHKRVNEEIEVLKEVSLLPGFFCVVSKRDGSPYKAWYAKEEPKIEEYNGVMTLQVVDFTGAFISQIVMDTAQPNDSMTLKTERVILSKFLELREKYQKVWMGTDFKMEGEDETRPLN